MRSTVLLDVAAVMSEGRDREVPDLEHPLMKKRKVESTLPLVSIIIPVHNSADFLEELFESILAQTYVGPMEVVGICAS